MTASPTSPSHHTPTLPPAVLANARKAEELAKQFAESQNPQPQAPAQPEPQPQPQPAQPEVQAQKPEPTVTQPGNEQQFQQPTTETPPRPDDFEQKFKSEQGRNKALRTQLDDLVRENAAMAAELKSLRERMAAPEMSFQPGQRLVTDEEIAEYGEDFMSVVEKKALEKVVPLQQQIADLQAKMDGVATQSRVSARQRMFDSLDVSHPNWREINQNPTFIDWLKNTSDDFSGQNLKSLLDSAVERNDASRVGRFIARFQQEHPAFAPQATPQPVHDPLADLAAPGRAKSAGTPVTAAQSAEKPFIKASQITQFYSDVTRGKYRGRDEERQRLERMFDEAVRDGRVTK
jgi:hypothetical protein